MLWKMSAGKYCMDISHQSQTWLENVHYYFEMLSTVPSYYTLVLSFHLFSFRFDKSSQTVL